MKPVELFAKCTVVEGRKLSNFKLFGGKYNNRLFVYCCTIVRPDWSLRKYGIPLLFKFGTVREVGVERILMMGSGPSRFWRETGLSVMNDRLAACLVPPVKQHSVNSRNCFQDI